MAGFNSGKNKSEKSGGFFKRKDKGNDMNGGVPNQQPIHQSSFPQQNDAMYQQQMQEQQRIAYQQQLYEQQQRLAYEQQKREEQQRLAYEQQKREELQRIREEEKIRQMQQASAVNQQFNGYQQGPQFDAPQNVNQQGIPDVQGIPNVEPYQPNDINVGMPNTNPQDTGLCVESHYDNKNINVIFDNQIERFYVESSNMKVATEPFMSKLHLKDDSNLDAIIGSILSDLEDEGVVGNLPRDIVGGPNNNMGYTQQYTPQYAPQYAQQPQSIPYEQKLSPIQSATGGNLMNMPKIPQGDNNLVGNKVSLDLEVL